MRHTRWALAYAGLILAVTLLPGPPIKAPPEYIPSALCLVCGNGGVADGIMNVLLFAPLGFALVVAGGKPLRAFLLVAGLSVVIELLQQVIPGRYPALGDVVYNAAGGSAGIGVAAVRGLLIHPERRLAEALTLATGALAGAVFVATGVLLTPSFPPTVYYGQWTADLFFLEAYEGEVLDASLGPMFLGSERAANPDLAVDLVRSGAPLDARVVAGPAPPALAPVVSIFDEYQEGILILGADATDLVLWLRYRADGLRLQRPDLRAPRALSGVQPGDTIRVRADHGPAGWTVSVDDREFGPLRHTAGEGWALLHDVKHVAPWVRTLINVAWVAGLLVLAGWWAPEPGWAAGALVLAMVGMTVAAIIGPLTSLAAAEILGAVGGVAAGLLLRAFLRKGSPGGGQVC